MPLLLKIATIYVKFGFVAVKYVTLTISSFPTRPSFHLCKCPVSTNLKEKSYKGFVLLDDYQFLIHSSVLLIELFCLSVHKSLISVKKQCTHVTLSKNSRNFFSPTFTLTMLRHCFCLGKSF